MSNFHLIRFASVTLLVTYLHFFSTTLCTAQVDNSSCITEACSAENLPDGLVGFYPFTKGSVNDFSDQQFHLDAVNNPVMSTDRFGNSNCAFLFTREGEEYLIGDQPLHLNNLENLTISLWYKPANENNMGRDRLSHVALSNVEHSFLGIDIDYDYGYWYMGTYDLLRPFGAFTGHVGWYFEYEGPSQSYTDRGSNLEEGFFETWHHVVMIGTGDSTIFYYDGERTMYESNFFEFNGHNQDGQLLIGVAADAFLDDVMLFDRILTEQQILQLGNLGDCCCCNEEPEEIVSIETCDPIYVWYGDTLSETGVYHQTLENIFGCDSTIILNLEINALEYTIVDSENDLNIETEQDLEIQWFNCLDNQVVVSEDYWFTPEESGEYRAIITRDNCTDTTDCFFVENLSTQVAPREHLSEIRVYPNPFLNQIQIDINHVKNHTLQFNIMITNVLGQQIYSQPYSSDGNAFTIPTSKWHEGVYTISIVSNKGEILEVFKLIK